MPNAQWVRDTTKDLKKQLGIRAPGDPAEEMGRFLDPKKRGFEGFSPDLRKQYYSNLASSAYTGGMGQTNAMQEGLRSRGLGKSSAFLTAPGAGARTQGQIFQQGALPFALEEGKFTEGQFLSDRDAVARERQRQQQWQQFLMSLDEQKREFNKSQKSFDLSTPFGGVSF